jgi:hypothetical protein
MVRKLKRDDANVPCIADPLPQGRLSGHCGEIIVAHPVACLFLPRCLKAESVARRVAGISGLGREGPRSHQTTDSTFN